MTVDDLAVLMLREFERADERMEKKMDAKIGAFALQVAKAFEKVDENINRIDGNILDLATKVTSLDRTLSSLQHRLVYKEDFDDLAARVKYVERKM